MELDAKEVAAVEAAAKAANEAAIKLLGDLSTACFSGGLGETCL
jgi:hypothetical protein